MCERFCLAHSSLKYWYGARVMPDKEPSYSIAPTTDVVVIRDGVLGRMGSLMRWSLILYWAKDTQKVPLLHNVRSEAIRVDPLVRKAFRQQRCLIPASGFYGTQLKADGTKQPFYACAKDGHPFSFAGIWATVLKPTGERINSCSIITIRSNALMQPIQERMPVIVPSSIGTPGSVPPRALMKRCWLFCSHPIRTRWIYGRSLLPETWPRKPDEGYAAE
ncbi:MAG: SOS response-associated peptidase [Nitrosospira sp.]